jgi:hypothetical protein
MDLADDYRIFHPTSAQYKFFSATHGTFSIPKCIVSYGTKQASANTRK